MKQPPALLLALLLAAPGLRAADDTAVAASRQSAAISSEEKLSYHTYARFGQVVFIRNDAAQPTPADVARRRGSGALPERRLRIP